MVHFSWSSMYVTCEIQYIQIPTELISEFELNVILDKNKLDVTKVIYLREDLKLCNIPTTKNPS